MYHSLHNPLSQYSVPVLLNVIRTSQFVFVQVLFVLNYHYITKARLLILTRVDIQYLYYCIESVGSFLYT
jgi:hypothetical protein